MTNPAFPNGPQNRLLARGLQAGILRSPDGTAKTPADLSWQNSGAPYRAPATDPITEVSELSDKISYAARNSDLPGPHNGPADAARHALMMAALTRKHGPAAARVIGVGNELYGAGKAVLKGESPAWRETAMDLWNNERGIAMAKEDIPNRELWAKIWDAAGKIPIPETHAESLREGLAGRLVALPPGKARDTTADGYRATMEDYARAFHDQPNGAFSATMEDRSGAQAKADLKSYADAFNRRD